MKFINYLKTISGVDIYPLAGLVIFGVFFLLVLLWVWKLDKVAVAHDADLPLQDGSQS